MGTVKPILTPAEHNVALRRIEQLMDCPPDSLERRELDTLTDLVLTFESQEYPLGLPDIVSAIEYRMDQQAMTRRDLVPYIGSRAKVSEVMSGKRDLTMSMARALHKHLGIPAEVLLQAPGSSFESSLEGMDFTRFPLRKMAHLGWIGKKDVSNLKDNAEELIRGLVARAGGNRVASSPLFRQNEHRRMNASTDRYALMAWCWQVLACADASPVKSDYSPDVVNLDFLRETARLSSRPTGPRLAKEFLSQHGIALEIVTHLPKTHLDGAALRNAANAPVIGMTLRYDRIDNFWFTLMHELAHVGRHADLQDNQFADDMSLRGINALNEAPAEKEADEWAEEALIPRDVWDASSVSVEPTAMAVIELAASLEIHPAIVAGRIRYERGNYRLLSQFVGSGTVRNQFEESHG